MNETATGLIVDQDLEKRKDECKEGITAPERARQEILAGNNAMRKQFERDWASEQARLGRARKHQVNLQTNVASEVRTEIHNESLRKNASLNKLLVVSTSPSAGVQILVMTILLSSSLLEFGTGSRPFEVHVRGRIGL